MSPIAGAAFWMITAQLSFVGMAVCGRELSDTMGTFEILFLRSGVSIIILVAMLPRLGVINIKSRHIGLHLFRNIIHFGAQFGWFLGIGKAPSTGPSIGPSTGKFDGYKFGEDEFFGCFSQPHNQCI